MFFIETNVDADNVEWNADGVDVVADVWRWIILNDHIVVAFTIEYSLTLGIGGTNTVPTNGWFEFNKTSKFVGNLNVNKVTELVQ